MRITQYKTILNSNGLPELMKEKAVNYAADTLSSAETISRMMRDVFQLHRQTEEYLYSVCLNTKLKPVGVFEISHGCVDRTIANPREILQKALMCGATAFIIIHNHPSGDAMPSELDRQITSRLKEAGEIVGISLLDSIILGSRGYYSFQQVRFL